MPWCLARWSRFSHGAKVLLSLKLWWTWKNRKKRSQGTLDSTRRVEWWRLAAPSLHNVQRTCPDNSHWENLCIPSWGTGCKKHGWKKLYGTPTAIEFGTRRSDAWKTFQGFWPSQGLPWSKKMPLSTQTKILPTFTAHANIPSEAFKFGKASVLLTPHFYIYTFLFISFSLQNAFIALLAPSRCCKHRESAKVEACKDVMVVTKVTKKKAASLAGY